MMTESERAIILNAADLDRLRDLGVSLRSRVSIPSDAELVLRAAECIAALTRELERRPTIAPPSTGGGPDADVSVIGSAFVAALGQHGFAIVPIKPSEAMEKAGVNDG
jgi:hypothetical protein